MRSLSYCLIGLLLGLGSSSAKEPAKTRAELLLGAQAAIPGSAVPVGLRLTMESGWHTYWRNPGESGSPTTIQWTLPEGITAAAQGMEGPAPEKAVIGGFVTLSYQDQVILLTSLSLSPSLAHATYPIKGKVQWLECSDKLCVPQSQDVAAELIVSAEPRAGENAALLAKAREQIPVASEALKPLASWYSAGTKEERPLSLQWSVPADVTHFDFYPYESKTVALRFTNEWSELKEGKVSLRRIVERTEGDWPDQISGLVAFGKADPASYRFHEVTFKLSSMAISVLSPPSTPVASYSISKLLGMLLYAVIGGIILNIMPCVLPVISLKILGFVHQSTASPHRVRQLGLYYACGVLVSFLVLAGVVIGLKAAGKAASWGIQFGNPQFLVILTSLITLVALNLFGVFEVTLGEVAGSADQLARKEGGAGAFFNGVLAVVLATPCTAPFLGLAIGFAIPQPPAIIVLFFSAVGVGLALPYLLLSWNSAWLKFLPRPGVWMERFKVAMGFPMLGVAIWLFWLAGKHFGERNLWFGFYLVTLAGAAWVYGQFIQRSHSRRGLAWGVFLALLGVAYGVALEKEVSWRSPTKVSSNTSSGGVSDHGSIPWKPWNAAAVAEARAQGRPILVDFTADWCVTCNVNRRTSIEIPSVVEKLKGINAVALLGDYTTTPDEITEELGRWGRGGVPLVLVYPADPKLSAQVLPEILTPSIMLEALTKAGKP